MLDQGRGGTDTWDVIIVGAGVAGLTAAILAAQAGFRTIVLERGCQTPKRPGETFHPGIEPILNKLGVATEIPRIATARPLGIAIRVGDVETKTPYGGPCDDPWRGFQIRRDALCRVLLDRAKELGATVAFGQSAGSILHNDGRGIAIGTDKGDVPAQWVVDATGPYGWSSRQDRSGYRRASPVRVVCFGYEPTLDRADVDWPVFSHKPWGWTYSAPLGDGQTAWVNLYNSRSLLKSLGPDACGVADGTWKVSEMPSNNRVYRIGDAACTLDPSSGKGVLRAMMSAIMSIHQISGAARGETSRETASACYADWVNSFFAHEVAELEALSPPKG